jgi:hypothetical protein
LTFMDLHTAVATPRARACGGNRPADLLRERGDRLSGGRADRRAA